MCLRVYFLWLSVFGEVKMIYKQRVGPSAEENGTTEGCNLMPELQLRDSSVV